MSIFNELFKIYKQTNKISIQAPVQGVLSQDAEFGDIIEIYSQNLIIAVAINSSEAILMSEFWEFATHTDLIVYIEHAIAEKWIIETDKRLYLPPNLKYHTCSKLNDHDKAILKDVLEGKPIPSEKSGPKTPFNPKDPRYKFKLEELKKTMLINKDLFFEEDVVVIPFNFTKNLFENEKKAAADEKRLFHKNNMEILVKPKEIIIDVGEENINKSIKIYLSEKEPIVLFEGKIEVPTFRITTKSTIENPYAVVDLLNIEIYDNKS